MHSFSYRAFSPIGQYVTSRACVLPSVPDLLVKSSTYMKKSCYPVYTPFFDILPAIALSSFSQQYVVMSTCRLAVPVP